MGKTYPIDINIVTKALRGLLSDIDLAFMKAVLESPSNLSVINRMELLGWLPNDPEFATDIALFVAASNEFGLTEEVIQQTIAIRRNVNIKLPDAIIAATAIVYNLTLLSDKDVDSLRGPKLKYINLAKLT